MTIRKTWLALILSVALTGHALAAVDLVTIPRREATQLTIYNSEDITMVREHRLLTVKPGISGKRSTHPAFRQESTSSELLPATKPLSVVSR